MPESPQTVGLFAGYGGLEIAVEDVIGAELVAYSEIDPAASKLLVHHHGDVPNLGDITAIDWAAVATTLDRTRALIVTGGFPCQDLSLAGIGKGMRPGTRSGLWTHMAYGIDQLRPDLVVIENVRGLLSADAACDLEPCPWCLGDDEGRPLRALGAVLGDLAELGYDARWVGLRAADVGAPHGRFRVFVAAWPAADADCDAVRNEPVAVTGSDCAALIEPAVRDADGGDCDGRGTAGFKGETGSATGSDPDPSGVGRGPARGNDGIRASGLESVPAADPAGLRRGEGRPEPARFVGGSDAAVGGDGSVADPDRVGSARAGRARVGRGGSANDDLSAVNAHDLGCSLTGPGGHGQERAAVEGDRPSPPDSGGAGRERHPERHLGAEGGQPTPRGGDAAGRVLDWGDYEPAVRRWESILGRAAPAPTQVGARGGRQLSPRFVEWMQGLPEGHVTDVPGLSRNDQLKMLGNGVVPAQAAAALQYLLGVSSGRVAA